MQNSFKKSTKKILRTNPCLVLPPQRQYSTKNKPAQLGKLKKWTIQIGPMTIWFDLFDFMDLEALYNVLLEKPSIVIGLQHDPSFNQQMTLFLYSLR